MIYVAVFLMRLLFWYVLAEKINVTQKLYGRISALSSLVVHHNERFTEFESSITPLVTMVPETCMVSGIKLGTYFNLNNSKHSNLT